MSDLRETLKAALAKIDEQVPIDSMLGEDGDTEWTVELAPSEIRALRAALDAAPVEPRSEPSVSVGRHAGHLDAATWLRENANGRYDTGSGWEIAADMLRDLAPASAAAEGSEEPEGCAGVSDDGRCGMHPPGTPGCVSEAPGPAPTKERP